MLCTPFAVIFIGVSVGFGILGAAAIFLIVGVFIALVGIGVKILVESDFK